MAPDPSPAKEELLFRIIASTRAPGVCRSCHAPLTWARTFPNNKLMPMTGDPIARKSEHHEQLGMIEFVPSSSSHFASCPFAKNYTKRSR